MPFEKYNEIENSYRQKFVNDFFNNNNHDTSFVIMEKIHGANFQILIDEKGNVKYASRNNIIGEEANFYNFQEALSYIDLSDIINYAMINNMAINLYGELHGTGVQKNVFYCDNKKLLFFDIKMNSEYLPFEEFEEFMVHCNLPMVPIIRRNVTLNESLDFDVENFNSCVSNVHNGTMIENNIAEGIVIKPMYDVIYNTYGKRFILKQKSKKFSEKANNKPKIKKEMDPIVKKYHEILLQYATETRMDNIFSKYGMIETPKQIGEYIKYFMEDAIKDFIKENPDYNEADITNKQKKEITNIGGMIVPILQKNL